jgi:hypothetical protein
VSDIFLNRFVEAKAIFEEKIKRMTVSGLGLKGSVTRKKFTLRVNVGKA